MLDVTTVGHRQRHVLVGNQIFDGKLAVIADDFRASIITVRVDKREQFPLENAHAPRSGAENVAHVENKRATFGQFFLEPLALQAGELGQTQIENRFGLNLA